MNENKIRQIATCLCVHKTRAIGIDKFDWLHEETSPSVFRGWRYCVYSAAENEQAILFQLDFKLPFFTGRVLGPRCIKGQPQVLLKAELLK